MITPLKFLFCSGIFRAIYTGNPAIHTHRDSNYSGIPSIRFCGRQGHIGAHLLWFQWYSYDGTIAAIFGGGLCNTESAGIMWDSEPCIVSSGYIQLLLSVCVLCKSERVQKCSIQCFLDSCSGRTWLHWQARVYCWGYKGETYQVSAQFTSVSHFHAPVLPAITCRGSLWRVAWRRCLWYMCVMSHTTRMPFCLVRNVVSLFARNLNVSRSSCWLGIFKVNFVFTWHQELCVVGAGTQKRFCKRRCSLMLELGSFVRLRKHISLGMCSLAKAESICRKLLILLMNVQSNILVFPLLVWSGTLYTDCYYVHWVVEQRMIVITTATSG